MIIKCNYKPIIKLELINVFRLIHFFKIIYTNTYYLYIFYILIITNTKVTYASTIN